MEKDCSQPIVLTAEPIHKGSRVDIFLSKKLACTRSSAKSILDAGAVSLGGQAIKASYKLGGAEELTIIMPRKNPTTIVPQNLPLDILYNDDDIVVINKARGMVVHPGAGVHDQTLCNALMFHFPDITTGNSERPGIVHRLDKETSGAMVIAKNHQALSRLSDDFKNRCVVKKYRAICCGEIAEDRFELMTGHARHPRNRLRYFTGLPVPTTSSPHVRLAHTQVSVVKRAHGLSEIVATILTGRTHQIRAHLADFGYPLLGDDIYGGKRGLKKNAPADLKLLAKEYCGQALHAESLEFTHPRTKEQMSFTAKAPAEFLAVSEKLTA